jgi:hypothetical protein
MIQRRPGGVTLLATLYIVIGFLSLLWSGLVLGIGGLSALTGWIFGQETIQAVGGASLAGGFIGLLSAAIQLVTGFGLLAMKKWAWILALVSLGFTVLQGLLGLFSGGFFGFLCGAIWLIIPAVMLFYLLKPDVRAAFNQPVINPAMPTATVVPGVLLEKSPEPAELSALDDFDVPVEKPVDPDTLPPDDDLWPNSSL